MSTVGIVRKCRPFDCNYWHSVAVTPYQWTDGSGKQDSLRIFPRKNTPRLLDQRLSRQEKWQPDQIWIGKDCDPYPAVEKHQRLTRRTVEVLAKHGFSLLILTKSPMFLRDIDLILEVHIASKATLCMTLSSIDPSVSRKIEPGFAPPARRLESLDRARRSGIHVGVVVSPLIPGVNDDSQQIENLFKAVSNYNFDFILFPDSYPYFSKDDKKFNKLILDLSRSYNIPLRIKRHCPQDYRRENYWLAEKLADRAYYRKLEGQPFRHLLTVARRINEFTVDIRSLIRASELVKITDLEPTAKPEIKYLLSGAWADRIAESG